MIREEDNMSESGKKKVAVGAGIALAGALLFAMRGRGVPDPNKATLFGNVTDAATGNGIKNVTVNCGDHTGKTDSRGDYRLINIEPGAYAVTFSHPDYQTTVV